MPQSIRRRYPILLFTLLYLALTFLTFKDFGETFDESGVYLRGMALGHHIVHDDFPSLVVRDPADDGDFYDHFYAMGLYLLNPTLNLDQYHLLNMIFALLIFIAIFEVLLSQTQEPWLSLSGPLFLFFTPRFMGDIPANPKDMPFAVFYFLSLTGIYFLHRRPQTHPFLKTLILGLLFGLTQSCRILGFTLYPVYLLFDLYFYNHTQKHSAKKWLSHVVDRTGLIFIVLIVSSFLMVITWPYLGCNFFDHFMEFLRLAPHFSWLNNVLFMGQEIPSAALPWDYLPVWFLITTPLFILGFLTLSLLNVRAFLKNELWILVFLALGINLTLYFLLHPILYDGLRHFLFSLPLAVVLASLGFIQMFKTFPLSLWFRILLVFAALNLLIVGTHLIRLHPYEYIYFNELTGGLKGAQGRFDNDYWGASFKETVEWLKQNEIKPDKNYLINGSGNAYQIFCYFTPNMKWTDNPKKADYYLSYTRDNKQLFAGTAPVIHVIERENVPLNYIYKMR